jgi:hypothetical protein
VPGVIINVLKFSDRTCPDVVDDDVHPAERIQRLRDGGLGCLRVGQVRDLGEQTRPDFVREFRQ